MIDNIAVIVDRSIVIDPSEVVYQAVGRLDGWVLCGEVLWFMDKTDAIKALVGMPLNSWRPVR